MNVIVLLNDTVRRDHINAYGVAPPWERPGHEGEPFIHTPNLDRLAAESALFDRFYCGSYPTIPCRYDLFTGRYGFPFRGWQPLEPDDVVLAELVSANGYLPMLIFDTPPLGNDDYNYSRGFEGWVWVRGQHGDRYITDPVPVQLPAAARKIKTYAGTYRYLRNTARRTYERDWMCGKTLSTAMDWLETNYTRDDFVLWVDMWDPHEPFDAPVYDLRRYADPHYSGDSIIVPRYGRADYMTPAELNHVRALYAAEVTLCDRWVGRFLEKVEALGLNKNTLIIYLSDHGHLFGEHGLQGKPTGPLGMLYEVTTRVPLMVRHPTGIGAGRRIDGLAQHCDVLPTILEFLDVPIPSGVQGKSLWPLIHGEVNHLREYAFSGRYSRTAGVPLAHARQRPDQEFDGWAGLDQGGEPLTVTSADWSLICPPVGRTRELYDLRHDPRQEHNLVEAEPEVVTSLHDALISFLQELGAPEQRIRLYA